MSQAAHASLRHALAGDPASLAPALLPGSFISCSTRPLPGAGGTLPYVLARFSQEHYTAAQFRLHALEVPVPAGRGAPKRQAEFAAGRICAGAALAAFGHGGALVGTGGHREPLWPAGMVGSISHSGQFAAAVACPATRLAGIGIDVESILGDQSRGAVMDLVTLPGELEGLRPMRGALDVDSLLTLVFSVKESFFKAAFGQVGAYFGFDAVRVCQVDPDQQLLRFRLQRTLAPSLVEGAVHEAHYEWIDGATVLTAVTLSPARQ